MNDDRIKNPDEEDVNDLLYRVMEYRNSAKFRKLLNFCVHFRRLSPFNAMLLAVQRPGCEFALTAHRWQRDYGRVPKTDVRPLIIIRPFGPVEYLFDVADTVAVDPNYDRVPEEVSGAFKFRQVVVDLHVWRIGPGLDRGIRKSRRRQSLSKQKEQKADADGKR